MPTSPSTGLTIVSEDEATGEIAEIYEEIKRLAQITFVPNGFLAVGASPGALKTCVAYWDHIETSLSLPQSLLAMIQYTVAQRNHCEYCRANNELYCRTLGVDEQTLANINASLEDVSPQRVRAIIEFAIKVAQQPKQISRADYDLLKEQGVTEEEILEIITVAAAAVAFGIMSDSLKIEVEPVVIESLSR